MRASPGALLCSLVAAALAGAPSPARAGEPRDDLRPIAGPTRPAAFVESVNRAIDRGVLWLRDQQAAKGEFGPAISGNQRQAEVAYSLGYTALGLYTLRSCGVAKDDPAIVLGLARLRQLFARDLRTNLLNTYEVSLTLLALEAHYAPPAEPGPAGVKGRKAPRDIPDADFTWMRNMAQWLTQAQNGAGGFGYSSPGGTWEDHSNLQFALLGLKAARRCGVDVPRAVFRRSLEHLLNEQERTGAYVLRHETSAPPSGDGSGKPYGSVTRAPPRDRARGWGYGGAARNGATGSMTAAGVSSLVICRGELLDSDGWTEEKDKVAVQGIRDGIAWLGKNFSVRTNPGSAAGGAGAWQYYYLYGLERAGVMAGVTWMASKDWYLEGANYLVEEQTVRDGKGAWTGSGGFGMVGGPGPGPAGNLLDTCFALLFLKKATFRVEGAVATEESDDDLDLSGTAALDDDSFRSVFDLVFARYLRADAAGRAARAADFVAMGTRALGPLILRLESAEEPERAAAAEALKRVTGLSQGFEPAGPEEARRAAVAAWEEWYFARRRGLVADPAAGRFKDPSGGER